MQKATERPSTTPIKNKYQSRYQYATKQTNYPSDISNRLAPTGDISLLKDYQSLKIHLRTLQNQNRNLIDQIEKMKIDRQHSQAKFIKEIGFKQNTFRQYQQEKNYQIDQMHIKFQEEVHRLRREKDKEYENLVREFKRNDLQLRQKAEKIIILQNKNGQLGQQIVHLEKQVLILKEANAELGDKYQQLSSVQKNLENNYKQLEGHRNQMEQQIRILLQIEAEKSEAIEILQLKLNKSQNSQKSLLDKLQQLGQSFQQLQNRLKQYSQKLSIKERQQVELKSLIDKMNNQLSIKQKQIGSLLDANNILKKQVDEGIRIQKIRQNQIMELISQNERLYNEINLSRHRIHDLAITYNFNV